MDIGKNVQVLRHPGPLRHTVRRVTGAIAIVLGSLIIGALDMTFNAPMTDRAIGFPLVVALIFAGGMFTAFLIGMPGFKKITEEQALEELRIGDLGMEIVQPIVPGQEPISTWGILWRDLISIKFRYRGMTDIGTGVIVESRAGQTQFLQTSVWSVTSAEGKAPIQRSLIVPLGITGAMRDQLEKSDVARALRAKGLKIEDDILRPQDRFAAALGLGMAVAAIIAALIFSYIESK